MARGAGLLLAFVLLFAARPAPAALWQAERAWSEEEEAGFAAWVESHVDPEFFVRAHLAHDCADVPYGLRWIYARERRLPVSATTNDGELIGNWSERFSPVTRGDWAQDEGFLAALRTVFEMTGTRTLPEDTYPVAIDAQHLRAGVVYREQNHSFVVGSVVLDGTEPHPLVTWESTLPPAVRPLRAGVFAQSAPVAGSGDGLRRFRWVEKTAKGYALVPLDQQPGYSEEQYSAEFLEGHPFAEAVARRLEPQPASPMIATLRYIAQADRLARERVPIVLAGHRACVKTSESCHEGGALWELYATPNRDARMLGYLQRVRALADDRAVEPDWVMDLLHARAIDVGIPLAGGGADPRRIDLADLYLNARFVSSEPGDPFEKRWGRAVCDSIADHAAALQASLDFLRARATESSDEYTAHAIEGRERELELVANDRSAASCDLPPGAQSTPDVSAPPPSADAR